VYYIKVLFCKREFYILSETVRNMYKKRWLRTAQWWLQVIIFKVTSNLGLVSVSSTVLKQILGVTITSDGTIVFISSVASLKGLSRKTHISRKSRLKIYAPNLSSHLIIRSWIFMKLVLIKADI